CNPPLKRLQDGKSLVSKPHIKGQKDVQYLQWLNGHLKLQWRSYHSDQEEQCKLLHKVNTSHTLSLTICFLYQVHFYTIGSHTDPVIDHFSVLEVDVGRQPERYKQPVREQSREEGKRREKSLLGTIQAVMFAGGSSVPSMTDSKQEPHSGRGAGRRESQEQHGAAYYSYEKLIKLWKFPPPSQETVLDMVIEDTQNQTMCYKDCFLPGSDLGCHSVSRIMEELDKCKKDLLSLYQELREHRTLKKLACCGEVRTRQEKEGEEDFCMAVRKVQEIVELKLSDLKCNNSTYGSNKLHGPYRLVYKKKCLKETKIDTIRTAASTKAIREGITATDVISFLKKKEARLKAQLKQRQEGDRQKIHKAAKKLGQVLFIPPMKTQKARIYAEVDKVHHI
ncbi:putative protein C14orf80, partial [Ophiophagus hannah]